MRSIRNIRKKAEFQAFSASIKKGSVIHWNHLAHALGINKDTITEWKKYPEVKKAIAESIQHALEEMERAGKDDWRMWLMKLKLLGVDPDREIEQDSGSKPNIIFDFGKLLNENNGTTSLLPTQKPAESRV